MRKWLLAIVGLTFVNPASAMDGYWVAVRTYINCAVVYRCYPSESIIYNPDDMYDGDEVTVQGAFNATGCASNPPPGTCNVETWGR